MTSEQDIERLRTELAELRRAVGKEKAEEPAAVEGLAEHTLHVLAGSKGRFTKPVEVSPTHFAALLAYASKRMQVQLADQVVTVLKSESAPALDDAVKAALADD